MASTLWKAHYLWQGHRNWNGAFLAVASLAAPVAALDASVNALNTFGGTTEPVTGGDTAIPGLFMPVADSANVAASSAEVPSLYIPATLADSVAAIEARGAAIVFTLSTSDTGTLADVLTTLAAIHVPLDDNVTSGEGYGVGGSFGVTLGETLVTWNCTGAGSRSSLRSESRSPDSTCLRPRSPPRPPWQRTSRLATSLDSRCCSPSAWTARLSPRPTPPE